METSTHATMIAGRLLAETASRLSRINPYVEYCAGVPVAGRWRRLSEYCDSERVRSFYEEALARCGDRRRAATIVAESAAAAAVHAWLIPVLADGRLALSGLGDAALHVHQDGWVDKVAVGGESVAVLPGDPAAGEAGAVVVDDRRALVSGAVERLLALEPAFECIRSACPIGAPALWGILLDAIAAQAVGLARMSGGDRREAWREAEAILEQVASRVASKGPRLKARPRPFSVLWSGGEELFTVRGTCCLYYRTVHDREHRGGYCNGCPLRTDESRAANLKAYLERTHGG